MRHAAVRDRDRPREEHGREREVRDEDEHPDEVRVHRDSFQLGLAQLAALRVVALEHLLTAPERLDHADPARVLLDRGREIAGLVLDAAHDRVVVALEAAAQHQYRDRGRHRQQCERCVQVEEQREDAEHLDNDDQEEDRAERREPSDECDVGARA